MTMLGKLGMIVAELEITVTKMAAPSETAASLDPALNQTQIQNTKKYINKIMPDKKYVRGQKREV